MRRGYRSSFDRGRGRGGRGGRGRGGQYHQPSFQSPSGMRYGDTQPSQSESPRHSPYGWGRGYQSPSVGYSRSFEEGAGKDESVGESSDSMMRSRSFDGSAGETKAGESSGDTSSGTLRDWYYDNEIENAVDTELSGEMRGWDFSETASKMEKHDHNDDEEPPASKDVGGWSFDATPTTAERGGEQREGGVLGKRKELPGDQDDEQSDDGSGPSGEKRLRLQTNFDSKGDAEERREWTGEKSGGETAAEGSSEGPAQGEGGRQDNGSGAGQKEKGDQQKKKPRDPPPPQVPPEEIDKINKKVLTVEGHISSDQFFCTLCLAKLNSKRNLQKHIVAYEHIRRISTVCSSNKSPFFCQICFCNCTSPDTLASHYQGKKHLRSVQIVEQSKASQCNHRPLGNLLDSLLKEEVLQEGDGLSMGISSFMMKFFTMTGPFIGLQYAMEVGTAVEPCQKYLCTLCSVTMDASNCNLHFTSAAHRTNVLRKDHPPLYSEISSLKLKKAEMGERLREMARQIEAREGRKVELIKRKILAPEDGPRKHVGMGRGAHRPPTGGYPPGGKQRAESQAGSWRDQQSPYLSQFGSPDQQSTRGQRGGVVRGRGRGRGFRENRGGRGTGKPFPGYNQGTTANQKPTYTPYGIHANQKQTYTPYGIHWGTHRGAQFYPRAPFRSETGTANQSSLNSQPFQSPQLPALTQPPVVTGAFSSPPAVRPPQWNSGGFAPAGGVQFQQHQHQAPTHPSPIPQSPSIPNPPLTSPMFPTGHAPVPLLLPPAAPRPQQPPFQHPPPPAMVRPLGPEGGASQLQQGFQDHLQEQIQLQVQEQIRKQVQEQFEKQFQQQQQLQMQTTQPSAPHTSAPPLQSLVRNLSEIGPDVTADVAQMATELVQSEEQAEMALQLSSALTQALLAYRIKSVSSKHTAFHPELGLHQSISDNPLTAVINALQSGGGIQLPGNQPQVPDNQQAQLPGNQ